jgi:predicted N-acyltransferase
MKSKALRQKPRKITSKGVKFKVIEGNRGTKLQNKLMKIRYEPKRLNSKVKL